MEWYEQGGALNIKSAQELEEFDLGTILINHTRYTVLTGYEGTGKCFWCGGELKGKLKRYCRGHMKEYYRHFEWNNARNWCCERQDGLCANCGVRHDYSLEVHHIVPLNGDVRYFTAYNLPWNLIALCRECHKDIHRVMRPPRAIKHFNSWEEAAKRGQMLFNFEG